jgi:putative membrane protein
MTQPTNPIKPTSKISLPSNFTPKTFIKLPPLTLPAQPKTTLSFKTHCSPPSDNSQTLISILHAIPDWADHVKERGMRQKRTLYDHEKWVQHRSSLRHWRHVMSSLSSRVVLSLVPPVIAFTSFAAIIAGYNYAVSVQWLPGFFPVLKASTLPYQLTAPALALLLVFRTEASYSRFEEGRKAWTKVIAGTNDLARQVIGGVESSGKNAPLKKALLQYIMAFPVALKVGWFEASNFYV